MTNNDEKKAKLEVNDKYQKAIDSILKLSTVSLLLPIIFLRAIVGFTVDEPFGGYLNGIISSWICLVLSITCCLFYYYLSAKFIKSIHNLKLSRFWEKHAEAFCHWSFGLSVIFFGFGIIYLILYVYLIYFRFY